LSKSVPLCAAAHLCELPHCRVFLGAVTITIHNTRDAIELRCRRCRQCRCWCRWCCFLRPLRLFLACLDHLWGASSSTAPRLGARSTQPARLQVRDKTSARARASPHTQATVHACAHTHTRAWSHLRLDSRPHSRMFTYTLCITESCRCLTNNPTTTLAACIGYEEMIDLAELACENHPADMQRVRVSVHGALRGGPARACVSVCARCLVQNISFYVSPCRLTPPCPLHLPLSVHHHLLTLLCRAANLQLMRSLVRGALSEKGTANANPTPSTAGMPPPPTTNFGLCDETTLTDRTTDCVATDPAALACIKTGATAMDYCMCLRRSVPARLCLAECWTRVEKEVCNDGKR
jgi:hypothetical protein